MFAAPGALAGLASSQHGDEAQALRTALQLFNQTSIRAWLGQVWSILTGRPRHLRELAEVPAARVVRGPHYRAIRIVPISSIRGSEGRPYDFDMDFRPLQTHTRGRWLSVAMARLQSVTLPPVELIQVGDAYFVWDGHHRISVAQALGEKFIDAVVTAS